MAKLLGLGFQETQELLHLVRGEEGPKGTKH